MKVIVALACLAVCVTHVSAQSPNLGQCAPIPSSAKLRWNFKQFQPCYYNQAYPLQWPCAFNHPSTGTIGVAKMPVVPGKPAEWAITSTSSQQYGIINTNVTLGLQR